MKTKSRKSNIAIARAESYINNQNIKMKMENLLQNTLNFLKMDRQNCKDNKQLIIHLIGDIYLKEKLLNFTKVERLVQKETFQIIGKNGGLQTFYHKNGKI